MVSEPASPLMASEPCWPRIRSLPPPPWISSLPGPAVIVSAPRPPRTYCQPRRVEIRSLPWPPVTRPGAAEVISKRSLPGPPSRSTKSPWKERPKRTRSSPAPAWTIQEPQIRSSPPWPVTWAAPVTTMTSACLVPTTSRSWLTIVACSPKQVGVLAASAGAVTRPVAAVVKTAPTAASARMVCFMCPPKVVGTPCQCRHGAPDGKGSMVLAVGWSVNGQGRIRPWYAARGPTAPAPRCRGSSATG